jgi:hypothetical protein
MLDELRAAADGDEEAKERLDSLLKEDENQGPAIHAMSIGIGDVAAALMPGGEAIQAIDDTTGAVKSLADQMKERQQGLLGAQIGKSQAEVARLMGTRGGQGKIGSLISGMTGTGRNDAMDAFGGLGGRYSGGGMPSRYTPPVKDFVYRGGSQGGVITPLNTRDEFLGMKKGGAIDKFGGGAVVININGGDEARVYRVVRKALAAHTKRGH